MDEAEGLVYLELSTCGTLALTGVDGAGNPSYSGKKCFPLSWNATIKHIKERNHF